MVKINDDKLVTMDELDLVMLAILGLCHLSEYGLGNAELRSVQMFELRHLEKLLDDRKGTV